jgi:hypothetical protein
VPLFDFPKQLIHILNLTIRASLNHRMILSLPEYNQAISSGKLMDLEHRETAQKPVAINSALHGLFCTNYQEIDHYLFQSPLRNKQNRFCPDENMTASLNITM